MLSPNSSSSSSQPYEGLDQLFTDIDSVDRFGYTALQRACKRGDLERVEFLLQHYADVHAETEHTRRTPLHLAAYYGHESVVKKLLEHGAFTDIWSQDNDGDTPLHLAAFSGNVGILRILSAAITCSDLQNVSASLDLLRNTDLQNFPPSLDLQNGKLQTPLHLAAGKGNLDAVKFLVDQKANINALDITGATPFHFGARCGHTLVMEILIKDIEEASYAGLTALHYAAWNGRKKAVEWLLAKGASLKARDKLDEDTPLHWAARNGNPNVIRTLVKEGADPCATNKNEELPLDVVDELKRSPAVTAICSAFRSLEAERKVGTDLMNPLATNGKEVALLHFIAAYGTSDDIEWIVAKIESKTVSNEDDHNMSIRVNITDKYGRNAMHWAARKGNRNPRVIQTLAKSKVNLQVEDKEGLTPLTHALMHRHLTFAKRLIEFLGNDLAEQWISNWDSKMKKNLKNDVDLLSKLAEESETLSSGLAGPSVLEVPFLRANRVLEEMPPLWTALHIGAEDIAKLIQQYDKDSVNYRGRVTGRTTLHWATVLKQKKNVTALCRNREFESEMLANMEDKFGKSALQYATEMRLEDIVKELMQTKDVQSWLDRLYNDRQVYVDAANAILVGAALIASVTFAGWLQPPLGDTPELFPKHIGIRIFWVFNSMSFFFAIATVLAGAGAVLPMPDIYIATAVSIIRRSLFYATTLFAISIFFVLGAFAAAGFAVLPSSFKYQANMMGTVIAGGIPCIFFLGWFIKRLHALRPRWFTIPISGLGSRRYYRSIQGNRPLDRSVSFINYVPLVDSTQSGPITRYRVGERYEHMPWEDGLDIVVL